VRVGDEDAPHEALVLQLAHLLAVPGGQADQRFAVEGADDRPVGQGDQPFRDRRQGVSRSSS
jgi:hypothetical protein